MRAGYEGDLNEGYRIRFTVAFKQLYEKFGMHLILT